MWRDTITVRLFASEAEMMIFKATFEGGGLDITEAANYQSESSMPAA
jgi:hypothetical protein